MHWLQRLRQQQRPPWGARRTAGNLHSRPQIRHRMQPASCAPINNAVGANAQLPPQYLHGHHRQYVLPYTRASPLAFHAKERHFGQRLVDVLVNDFRSTSEKYVWKESMHRPDLAVGQEQRLAEVQRQLERQEISVNNVIIDDASYVLQAGDHVQLHTTVHVHEPVVLDLQPTVLQETDELLVIDKPPSLPVHPVSKYYYNTLAGSLGLLQQPGGQQFHAINRLDLAASGVVLLAKSPAAAKKYMQALQLHRNVTKVYLARVHGRVSDGVTTVTARILSQLDASIMGVAASRTAARSVIDEVNGRAAETRVEMLGYNSTSNTSLVRCTALTGRMHQIRLHLSHIGHPIANDSLYFRTAEGNLSDKLVSQADSMASLEGSYRFGERCTHTASIQTHNDYVAYLTQRHLVDLDCAACWQLVDGTFTSSDPPLYKIEATLRPVIWLHALSVEYTEFNQMFQTTSLPSWASV